MPSLALAWNITNTPILGGFVATAVREHRSVVRDNRAAPRVAGGVV